jgi:hypothetical protein
MSPEIINSYCIIGGTVEGTDTTTAACLATFRLYLGETVVTSRGFSNVAALWP